LNCATPEIFGLSGITSQTADFTPLGGAAAVQALKEGRIDAAFLAHSDVTLEQQSALESDLEDVDRAASILGVPMRHSELFFSLKAHIDLVRSRLGSRRADTLRPINSQRHDASAPGSEPIN